MNLETIDNVDDIIGQIERLIDDCFSAIDISEDVAVYQALQEINKSVKGLRRVMPNAIEQSCAECVHSVPTPGAVTCCFGSAIGDCPDFSPRGEWRTA